MREKRTRLMAMLLSVSMTLTLFCGNTLAVGTFALEAAKEKESSALASEMGEESSSAAAIETSSGSCGTNLKFLGMMFRIP